MKYNGKIIVGVFSHDPQIEYTSGDIIIFNAEAFSVFGDWQGANPRIASRNSSLVVPYTAVGSASTLEQFNSMPDNTPITIGVMKMALEQFMKGLKFDGTLKTTPSGFDVNQVASTSMYRLGSGAVNVPTDYRPDATVFLCIPLVDSLFIKIILSSAIDSSFELFVNLTGVWVPVYTGTDQENFIASQISKLNTFVTVADRIVADNAVIQASL